MTRGKRFGIWTACAIAFLVCTAAPVRGQSASSEDTGCENGGSLQISPVFVNMLAGDTQQFSLFDNAGRKLTFLAEWSIDDPHVADLAIEKDIPVLTGKETGRVRLTARVGSETGEAIINVVTPEDVRSGKITTAWLAPPGRCPEKANATRSVPSVSPLRPCTAEELELTVSPPFANIPVGQSRPFKLFDAAGHNVTSEAEWSMDRSYVADLSLEDGVPVVRGKEVGTAHVTVRRKSATRDAIVSVFREEDLTSGRAQLTPSPLPCARSIGTVRPLPPEALPTPQPNSTKPQ